MWNFGKRKIKDDIEKEEQNKDSISPIKEVEYHLTYSNVEGELIEASFDFSYKKDKVAELGYDTIKLHIMPTPIVLDRAESELSEHPFHENDTIDMVYAEDKKLYKVAVEYFKEGEYVAIGQEDEVCCKVWAELDLEQMEKKQPVYCLGLYRELFDKKYIEECLNTKEENKEKGIYIGGIEHTENCNIFEFDVVTYDEDEKDLYASLDKSQLEKEKKEEDIEDR